MTSAAKRTRSEVQTTASPAAINLHIFADFVRLLLHYDLDDVNFL